MISLTPYSGITFWIIAVVFVGGMLFLEKAVRNTNLKSIYVFIISIVVIYSSLSIPLIQIILLFAVSTVVYLLGRHLNSGENLFKELIAIVVFIILFLCYFKYNLIQSSINNIAEVIIGGNGNKHIYFVGVSYFTFKYIHFLIECSRKNINNLSYLTFLNYILFFPSFFSGPINRYNSFATTLQANQEIFADVITGGKRIINGLFKKIVLGDTLFAYSIVALDLDSSGRLEIVLSIYAYMFFVYFNFSGYTDMAIGVAKMVGIELPENFNYPFFKRNLQQFWANWHMSLTTWLTDYIYWPCARKLRKFPSIKKKPVTNSNICIIITFLVCGLWHGDGLNFIIWGIYHGFGLAILNCYTYSIKKFAHMKVRRFVSKSSSAYVVSNVITFQYVAFGFLLFGCDIDRLKVVFSLFT